MIVVALRNEAEVALSPEARIVLRLPTAPGRLDRTEVDRCLAEARDNPHARVCLIGTFAVDCGDRVAQQIESEIRREFRRVAPGRLVVLRVGRIHQTRKSLGRFARLTAALHPLVSPAFRSCYVEEAEVVAAMRDLTEPDVSFADRTVTLLGVNRSLGEVWSEQASTCILGRLLTAAAWLLSWLLIGRLIGLGYRLVARLRPGLRRYMLHTLVPQSNAELLALYNPWNRRHVVLAGYNAGIDHFGWKFPGRTIVMTTGCGKRVRIRTRSDDDTLDVDAGVTIKRVVGELARAGRQLYVVPNYSYVTMGTAFFVPIHGSGGDVSVLGDTIEKVLLYDPLRDRLVSVRRDEPDFVRTMYSSDSGMLALRLRFRTRPHARYFMKRTELEAPTADDVWRLFDDREASNIELRKSSAASSMLQVAKFYQGDEAGNDRLEIPRDSIGRTWDRLEENPVSSVIFHGLVRRYAFHVELFLDRDQFEIFWREHATLPLKKLQFRFVRRDGLPSSPFGRRDCISVDLFMSRSVRDVFLTFMKEKLPHAGFNRGKHSM